jgi:hypothetical protein
MTYETLVTSRFPCPEGHRELKPGEAIDTAIDRLTMTPQRVIGWDGPQLILDTSIGHTRINPIWYVTVS